MADAYPYLIASLPMLHFGMRPPFSFERFLGLCREWIPEEDYRLLATLPQPEEYSLREESHRFVRRWIGFDTVLRNDLARLRAARRHLEPAPYLRPEPQGGSIPQGVLAAAAGETPLGAERALDELRWKALEGLATGHHLDLEVLLSYALRLRILLRWERIRAADAGSLLGEALGGGRGEP